MVDQRWARLFGDLEAQAQAAGDEELTAEVADRTRREVAQVALIDRIRAATASITVRLAGAHVVEGQVEQVGADWFTVVGHRTTTIVRLEAIREISGLGTEVAVIGRPLEGRLGIGFVLRELARDRGPVLVGCVDGSNLGGVVARVGADFIDLTSAPGEQRSAYPGSGCRAVPIAAIAVLRPA